ncbi:MAG TPA: YciI family protein [Thermomonas sp.]|nr:YciI family protein [Thermomonas sp.]
MRLLPPLALSLCIGTATAVEPATPPAAPAFDAVLAQRTGADARGMRRYVLVILKTGPTRVPDGKARDEMFAGHMRNIERLAKAGKLALAGPFMKDPTGWRGLFVFAVDDIEEAKALVATDPVIIQGEMVAEYHPWYGSAANMLVSEWHDRLVPPPTATP